MKKSAFLYSFVLALFLGLSACAPTDTSRSTGQTIDDAALTTRVKTNLAQSTGMSDALQINVDTYRGVVSLSGFVNSEEQKQLATKAAKEVSGVHKVQNNLMIKPPERTQ